MAAPSATARGTPTGRKLLDGHPTLITFARFPTVNFWEVSGTPMGEDGGDPVDITTFFNTNRRTYAPRQLMEGTEGTWTVAYDPAVLSTIRQMINIHDTCTVTHPDGSTEARFAYLRSFIPQENSEGEMPLAEVTIQPLDVDTSGAEQEPVIVSVAGT
jgi:hypothetical protein